MARPRISAGLIMYRRAPDGALLVLLAHPGGPLFARKDERHWTIPKGEPRRVEREDLLVTARREFMEETGLTTPNDGYVELGAITQKGGKIVHAWGFAGEIPEGWTLDSSSFELEWPPHSGQMQYFPEVDRLEWFDPETARRKIKPAQIPLLERLEDALR